MGGALLHFSTKGDNEVAGRTKKILVFQMEFFFFNRQCERKEGKRMKDGPARL